MAERVQTYKNHTRLLPPFHFFVIPVLLLNFLNDVRHTWMDPSLHTAFAAVVGAALLLLGFLSRVQAVTVQDRVSQLVALRFAGDAELPELVRETLDGKLTTEKAIKLRVKNWQADWLRA
jgi:hypothetical protein